MNNFFHYDTPGAQANKHCLLQGEVLSGDETTGSIACLRGRLWITQTGLGLDVLLGAGQSFQPRRGGMLVIEALEPACVEWRSAGLNRPFTDPKRRRCIGTEEI